MYILTPCDVLCTPIYYNMCVTYSMMGLSKEEICKRISCKTAAVIRGHHNGLKSDECDRNSNYIHK